LQEVLREFGLPCGEGGPSRWVRTLTAFLLRESAAGRTALLVLDEAQNLLPEVLEEIRLLSNLETESSKLLHIVLAGQPELNRLLGQPGLRQLNQRISVRYHLGGMDAADTRGYICHRLARVGGVPESVFRGGALRAVHRLTGGVPRLISVLCDRCLLLGFSLERPSVSSAMVRAAWRELRMGDGRFVPLRRKPALRYFSLAVLLLSLVFWGMSTLFRAAPARYLSPSVAPAAHHSQDSVGQRSQYSGQPVVAAAFDALAGVWQVSPLSEREGIRDLQDLWAASGARGLQVSRIEGSLGSVLRLNYPLLIEVSDGSGSRLLALLSGQFGTFRIAPPLNGVSRVGLRELEELFTGQAFLLWHNALDLPQTVYPGAKGPRISDLQYLLNQAGNFSVRVDGIYGPRTMRAVMDFQLRQGLPADETLGTETLLLLYQTSGRFDVPKLRG
jgi:general secretion pathway protein A